MEIVFAIVLVGIISAGFFTAVMTSASASKAHRDMATADGVLRDYAEAAKQGVRTGMPGGMPCTAGTVGQSFTITYTPPSDYPVTASGLTCPPVASVRQASFSVHTPTGLTRVLNIDLRMP